MAIPIWSGRYIGLPFKEHGRDRTGVDCWGLVRLIFSEQFGEALPSFSSEYKNSADYDAIAKVMIREAEDRDEIAFGNEELGDVIIFSLQGQPAHLGIIIGDGHMIHIERHGLSSIERYDGPRWKDKIYGIFE